MIDTTAPSRRAGRARDAASAGASRTAPTSGSATRPAASPASCVAAAVVAFVIEVTDNDATLPGVGFNVGVDRRRLAAGYFVRGPVRSAAVAALVFAIPQVWLFAIIGDGEGVDRGDFRIILLLSVATYVVFYALTWTRADARSCSASRCSSSPTGSCSRSRTRSVPFGVDAATQVRRGGFNGPQQLAGGDDHVTETADRGTGHGGRAARWRRRPRPSGAGRRRDTAAGRRRPPGGERRRHLRCGRRRRLRRRRLRRARGARDRLGREPWATARVRRTSARRSCSSARSSWSARGRTTPRAATAALPCSARSRSSPRRCCS